MMNLKAERLLPHIMVLGEGPVWDETADTLHWVDITAGQLWQHDFNTGKTAHKDLGQSAGMCALTKDGGMIAALKQRVVLLDEQGQRDLTEDAEPYAPNNRFNDGKCDAVGRLLVGTMHWQGEPGQGALYSLDMKKGNAFKKLLSGITVSNGLGFSLDNKALYYADTPSGFLWRFDYDLDTGNIANRTPVIDYRGEEGMFDGLTVDSEGCVWVAHWGGFQVSRWDPHTGKKLLSIPLPVPLVTSCCFGGPNMSTLYITSAWDMNEQVKRDYPLSGSLFVCETGVKGRKAERFAV